MPLDFAMMDRRVPGMTHRNGGAVGGIVVTCTRGGISQSMRVRDIEGVGTIVTVVGNPADKQFVPGNMRAGLRHARKILAAAAREMARSTQA